MVTIINIILEEVTLRNITGETTCLLQFHLYQVNSAKNRRILALPKDVLSVNNFCPQGIRLTDINLVYVKKYRIPEVQKAEINRQVMELLGNNIIEPSKPNYNSPILLVPKK